MEKLKNKIKKLTREQIGSIVFDYYWEKYQGFSSVSDKVYNLVMEILTRGQDSDHPETLEALGQAENDENIYTDDHWEIMKEYSDGPESANYRQAMDEFGCDLMAIHGEILKGLK